MKRRDFIMGASAAAGAIAGRHAFFPNALTQATRDLGSLMLGAPAIAAAPPVAPKDRADYLKAVFTAQMRAAAWAEGTYHPELPDYNPYRVLQGSSPASPKMIDSFDRHPGGRAGAYQFSAEQYAALRKSPNIPWRSDLPEFHPTNQDWAFIAQCALGGSYAPLRLAVREKRGRLALDWDGWQQSVAIAAATWPALTSRPFTLQSRFLWELWGQMAMLRNVAFPLQGYTYSNAPWTSPFGYRVHPISGDRRLHRGVDVGVPTGTVVLATEDGTVSACIANNGGAGHTLEFVADADFSLQKHFHLSRFLAKPGTWVAKGTPIAEVGSTGGSTGPHMHFELWVWGQPVDPKLYLGQSEWF